MRFDLFLRVFSAAEPAMVNFISAKNLYPRTTDIVMATFCVCHISICTVQSGLVLVSSHMKGLYSYGNTSLTLAQLRILPPLSVNSVYSNKEKHITQQLSIHLFFPSPPLRVFVCSAPSAPAPAFYTSLCVLSDGNRQLLKASMKCQRATVCVPKIPFVPDGRESFKTNNKYVSFIHKTSWALKILANIRIKQIVVKDLFSFTERCTSVK